MVLLIVPCVSLCQIDNEPRYFAAILVTDIDASIDWYSANLGFEVVNRTDLEDRGISIANLKFENIHLELIETGAILPRSELLKSKPDKMRIAGLFKFGFAVNDFDKKVDELKEQAVELQGSVVVDPINGKKMVIVLDNDGNRIQLFEK